jgi:hypothetical protein
MIKSLGLAQALDFGGCGAGFEPATLWVMSPFGTVSVTSDLAKNIGSLPLAGVPGKEEGCHGVLVVEVRAR